MSEETHAAGVDRWRLQAWLRVDASAKPKVYEQVFGQKELLDKVRPVIQEFWPSDAPIQDFDVVLGTAGIAIDVRYQATSDLSQVAINMVLQSVRAKLGMPDLILNAERIPPPIPANSPAKATKKRKRK
jgi:hypothetical protein